LFQYLRNRCPATVSLFYSVSANCMLFHQKIQYCFRTSKMFQ
jgi:hypothetical protein